MKTVTSYLSLILSLLFVVSCGDTGPYFVPNKPEVIKPGVTSHFVHIVLDISPLPISTRSSASIKDGFFFLVSRDDAWNMKLVERVYFDESNIDSELATIGGVTIRYLKINLKAKEGKYLALVLANPTDDIKQIIEKSETPWLETLEFKEEYLKHPGGLEKVLTNIIPKGKSMTLENLYPTIEVGAEETVVIPLGRILSKISLQNVSPLVPPNFPGKVVIRPILSDSEHRQIPVVSFLTANLGLVNIPKKLYLWPNYIQMTNNKLFPISPHKGAYIKNISESKNYWNKTLSDYVYFQNNETTIGGTHGHIGVNFEKNSYYLPENIGTVYNENSNDYEAYRGCVTAIIIRVRERGLSDFVSFQEAGNSYYNYLVHSDAKPNWSDQNLIKKKDKILYEYNGYMYYYYYIVDPNYKVSMKNGRVQSFPAIFRNTNYTINMPKLHKIGTNAPGLNLRKAVDRSYNVFNELESVNNARFKGDLGSPESQEIIITTEE